MQTSAMIARLMEFHGHSPFCYFLVVGMQTDQPINRQRMLTVERWRSTEKLGSLKLTYKNCSLRYKHEDGNFTT